MAEVLGVASAVDQLLGIAIDLIKILCRAYERQKDLARLLDSHLTELTSLRDVIHIVEEEGALQTTNVAATLARLKASEKKLIAWLKRVDPGSKSSMQQFSRQLAYGSKDQKLLTEIMNEISRAKTDLCMDINVAHVGVTRTVESGVVANSKAVRRIERRPARFSSKERELNTARPLEDRSTHADNSVLRSEAEIMSRSANGPGSANTNSQAVNTERIIIGNSTKGHALMINAQVGEGLANTISRREIRNNVAEDKSTMVNDAISLDALKLLVDR